MDHSRKNRQKKGSHINFGGEAAPDIPPEQFEQLMEEGRLNIDGRGRVRATRSGSAREGMSLRKRRAWYDAR